MNLSSVHNRIKTLIEQTNDAFFTCGTVNADYAEFATLAIADFKSILRDPALTEAQLKKMLRGGMSEFNDKQRDPGAWAAFMAHHIALAANVNVTD